MEKLENAQREVTENVTDGENIEEEELNERKGRRSTRWGANGKKNAKQVSREEVEKSMTIKIKRKAENNMKERQKVRRKVIRLDIYSVEVLKIKIFVPSCLAGLHA